MSKGFVFPQDFLSIKDLDEAYGIESLVRAFIEQPEGNISFPYLMGIGGMNINAACITYRRRHDVETPYRELVRWASSKFKWRKITAFGKFLTVHLEDRLSTTIDFKIEWTKTPYFRTLEE